LPSGEKVVQVRLYIRVRLASGKRIYANPAYAANGRIKPLYAVIADQLEHHPEGVYHLRYVKGGKRVWEPVGTDAYAAITAQIKREKALAAKAAGVAVLEDDAPSGSTGRDLGEAIVEYLSEVKHARAKSTYNAYGHTLRQFQQTCSKNTVQALERGDVLTFIGDLREEGASARTIVNKLTYLKTFILHYQVDWPLLKTDRIKYTEKTVEAYSAEDLNALFAAATREETDLFQFLLCTGVREQEAMYATWADVDFNRKKFFVREKHDQLVFTPKDHEERSIPIPDSLLDLLRARRKRLPHARLIFPASDGRLDYHFLRVLQDLAFRAGLNCGECFNKKGRCCSNHAMCHRWGLHRFRKTFATMHHEAGVSVRTIQRWLGHSSLDTTLRYLAGSEDGSEKTRSQVNSTFACLQQGKIEAVA
jgi:integrase/recombinase XerD